MIYTGTREHEQGDERFIPLRVEPVGASRKLSPHSRAILHSTSQISHRAAVADLGTVTNINDLLTAHIEVEAERVARQCTPRLKQEEKQDPEHSR